MKHAQLLEKRSLDWPKDDQIRWVQWRIRERETIEAGTSPSWCKQGDCQLTEYRAWLLHEQEGRSFVQIGEQLFRDESSNWSDPNKDQPNNPDELKQRAYRAFQRVEREFGRGPLKKKKSPPGFRLHAWGVIPA